MGLPLLAQSVAEPKGCQEPSPPLVLRLTGPAPRFLRVSPVPPNLEERGGPFIIRRTAFGQMGHLTLGMFNFGTLEVTSRIRPTVCASGGEVGLEVAS